MRRSESTWTLLRRSAFAGVASVALFGFGPTTSAASTPFGNVAPTHGTTASTHGKIAPTQDKTLASIREEQELLLRQLQRLRQTMEVLLARLESESDTSTRRVELLRAALVQLDEREQEQARTLEEWMSDSAEGLDRGLVLQAAEAQERAVAELETLLTTLLDRSDPDDLEERIEALQEVGARLASAVRREREIEREIERLREDSTTQAQRDWDAALDQLIEEQRALEAATQDAGRRSRDFEFEWLDRQLNELIEAQSIDAELFAELDAEAAAALERAEAALSDSRRAADRLARTRSETRELERAADELRSGDAESAARTAERLEQSASEATSRAEVAPAGSERDAALEGAQALADAARAAREAAIDPEQSEAAAAAVEQLAMDSGARAERELAATTEQRDAAEQALEGLRSQDDDQPRSTAESLADDVQPALEAAAEALEQARNAAADGSPDTDAEAQAESSITEALRAIERGRGELMRLSGALERSQETQAARTDSIEQAVEGLDDLPPEEAQAAAKSLESAAARMRAAAESAGLGQNEQAATEAARARAELESAQASLGAAREAAGTSESDREAAAELAERQAELEQRADELAAQANNGDLSDETREAVEQALDEARESMRSAGSELQQGRPSAAAPDQSSALENLQSAESQANSGRELRDPEAQARAEQLAKDQEDLREEILELAQLNAEREESQPLPSLDDAADSAGSAAQNLRESKPEPAERDAEQARRELEEAQRELEQERQRYEQLRQEEVLFQISEETLALLEAHREQMERTLELDQRQSPGERPARAVRLGLRSVAREEAALAARSDELATALEEEGSVVFGAQFRAIQTDLEVIARDMDETGDYQSGERVQAIQADVEEDLEFLLESLQEEQRRREQQEQEQQEQQQQQESQEQQGENRLVPDVAELKLLRRMEIELQGALNQIRLLYPEIEDGTEIDPLVFDDVRRLATRHERLSTLFSAFRSRLGVPDPVDPELAPSPDDAPGSTDDADSGSGDE